MRKHREHIAVIVVSLVSAHLLIVLRKEVWLKHTEIALGFAGVYLEMFS